LSPFARRTAFLRHCNPTINSRPPTTSRSAGKGTSVRAGPSAATITTSTATPPTTPAIAERQSRLVPAASTIVSASTASTRQAKNTATNNAPLLTATSSTLTAGQLTACATRHLG
jgi:hypothetical protein